VALLPSIPESARWLKSPPATLIALSDNELRSQAFSGETTRMEARVTAPDTHAEPRREEQVVLAVSLAGKIDSWAPSATARLGRTSEQLQGLPLADLFTAQTRSEVLAHLQRATMGEVLAAELECQQTPGSALKLAMLVPFRDIHGDVAGVCAILRGRPKPADRTSDTAEWERHFLHAAVVQAADRERRLIAQEVHDHLCQQLLGAAFSAKAIATGLSKSSSAAAQLEELAALINSAVRETREIARRLDDRVSSTDFETVLRQVTQRHARGIALRAELKLNGEPPASALASHTCRIAQEAVSNSARHSGASEIIVRANSGAGSALCLEIADNGRGFALSEQAWASLGLASMHSRAQRCGGHLCIHTTIGRGTIVLFVVPM
jgi:signal transduction histidine kinase